ncbi:HAD-IIIA family hydrolase [Alkalihalobacillus sp. AL-G]|nr:HAD-IIIA family hydrolase [Alkalihalobacillus sp. AL-G]
MGGGDTVHYPGDFKLFSFSQNLINMLKEKGIKVFSFTNQPGTSNGLANEADFIKESESFGFDDVYLCPHHHSVGCACRKPGTGMLLEAAEKHALDLKRCVVIGDRWSDIVAASTVGATKILVKTGAGNDSLNKHRHLWTDTQPDYIAEDLKDAVEWMFSKGIKEQ